MLLSAANFRFAGKNMKYIIAPLIIIMLTSNKTIAQTENEVSIAVELLKKAMVDGNITMLANIASDSITYGHSSGVIEHKPAFLQSFKNGSSDFININLTDQSIQLFGNTAIVRHILDADTNNDNKPGHVSLKVLLVWQKQNGEWKLLARQAVKFAN